jgi:hypothetical protein
VKTKAPDLAGSGLLVVLGAVLAFASQTNYELFGEGGRIGPGFMPFFSGLLLLVFGVTIGLGALVGGPGDPEEAGVGDRPEAPRYAVGVVFALTLAAIVLIPVLGFLVSFGLLIFVLVSFVEREGVLRGLVLGAGAAGLAWLVFVYFLQIPLPTGVLGTLAGG